MAATLTNETLGLLAKVPVFETLSHEDLVRVGEVAVPRSFAPMQVVFREGDASDTCYIVRSGHARAIRAHGDGRTITLANFGTGDIFGGLAMFERESRSATVEATSEMQVIAILGGDMRRLLGSHHEMAFKLVIALGRRLRETNERLARQSFQTVQSRVASVLEPVRRGRAGPRGRNVRGPGHGRPRPTSPSSPGPPASRRAGRSRCWSGPA